MIKKINNKQEEKEGGRRERKEYEQGRFGGFPPFTGMRYAAAACEATQSGILPMRNFLPPLFFLLCLAFVWFMFLARITLLIAIICVSVFGSCKEGDNAAIDTRWTS